LSGGLDKTKPTPLQGEELEQPLSLAREAVGLVAYDTLWYGLRQLERQPRCVDLDIESLGAVLSRALRDKIEELNLLATIDDS
jgi:hypothetical protein